VAARSAVFAFKGKAAAPAELARALDVDYLLEGSVHKGNGTLRITAQLIRVDRNFIEWSQSYDRPDSNLLAVQDEIAADLRHALQSSLAAKPAR
jgi:TolB-like protein